MTAEEINKEYERLDFIHNSKLKLMNTFESIDIFDLLESINKKDIDFEEK